MRKIARASSFALVCTLALAVAGCGGDSDTTTDEPQTPGNTAESAQTSSPSLSTTPAPTGSTPGAGDDNGLPGDEQGGGSGTGGGPENAGGGTG